MVRLTSVFVGPPVGQLVPPDRPFFPLWSGAADATTLVMAREVDFSKVARQQLEMEGYLTGFPIRSGEAAESGVRDEPAARQLETSALDAYKDEAERIINA
jgi:hypothetical protein